MSFAEEEEMPDHPVARLKADLQAVRNLDVQRYSWDGVGLFRVDTARTRFFAYHPPGFFGY